MISVPKKVEYSLFLISDLAKKRDKLTALSEVAKRLNLPYRFLSQLAIGLKKAGVIEGKEGKGGGYKLSLGWQRKNVFDLVVALGEVKELVKCQECGQEGFCRMKQVWGRVEQGLVKELKQVRLCQL
jgi:Rrf2 family protein